MVFVFVGKADTLYLEKGARFLAFLLALLLLPNTKKGNVVVIANGRTIFGHQNLRVIIQSWFM